jgi:hypothetical protein
LLAPSEIPWENIDIQAARISELADPKQPEFDYEIEFLIDHDGDVDVVVTLTPPDGFLFAGDVADPIDLSPNPGPDPTAAEQEDGSLVIELGVLSPGWYELAVAMRAGVELGSFEGSVEVVATPVGGGPGGSSSTSTDSTVVEAAINEPGSAAASPELLGEVLELAHVSSSEDIDLYQFDVDGTVAGDSAKILLSNLPADYDLVLYGPPLAAPLRGTPLPGYDAIEDFVYDLNPDDDVLDTDTLQDVPHDPAHVGLNPATTVLHSVASKRGTTDEEISTGTLQAGTYFVQVSAYNSTLSEDPYLLRMRLTAGIDRECPASPFTYVGGVAPALPLGYPADLNTIFLYNHERLTGEFAADAGLVLTELGLVGTTEWTDLGVIGAVVAIDADPGVLAELQDLSLAGKRCNPHESNDVVREVGELIDGIIASLPSDTVRNIVLVGGDEMVPFARIPDGTTISNERSHGLTFEGNNETIGALLAGYYFSDDPYGSDAGILVNNHELFVPRRAVGRLVETPVDIAGALFNFRDYDGLLDPSSGATVTGYDFLSDGAALVESNLTSEGFSVTSLINETWTRQDLIDLLTGNGGLGPQDFSIGSINAHFDQGRALPAEGNATGDESDLFTIADLESIDLTNALLFSMGCHSGLSVSDVQIGSPAADWAETNAGMGNLWSANTGYGYGDTQIVALSEALTAEFAGRLGSMTAGEAWMAAKQDLASKLFTIDPYHEKIMQEFVFYGLPMFLTGPADAAPAPGGGPGGGGTSATGSGIPLAFAAELLLRITAFPGIGTGPVLEPLPDPSTGLDVAEIAVSPTLTLATTPDGDS